MVRKNLLKCNALFTYCDTASRMIAALEQQFNENSTELRTAAGTSSREMRSKPARAAISAIVFVNK
jgi:hypothetical protein